MIGDGRQRVSAASEADAGFPNLYVSVSSRCGKIPTAAFLCRGHVWGQSQKNRVTRGSRIFIFKRGKQNACIYKIACMGTNAQMNCLAAVGGNKRKKDS